MLAILIIMAIVGGIAFFLVFTQGLFNSLIMCVLCLISALIAFNYYELLGSKLNGIGLASYGGTAISLMGLFLLSLLVMRLAFDRLIKAHVDQDRLQEAIRLAEKLIPLQPWRLDLQGNLAHDKWCCINRGSDSALIDSFQSSSIPIITQQNQVVSAKRFGRHGGAHDHVIIGRENDLDFGMSLKCVHAGRVAALNIPLAVQAGDHLEIGAFDGI